MELTIIGPWGGYPKAGGASAGYLLEYKDTKLLLDCGSGVLSKLQTIIQPEDLDAIILTHYHADHMADIGVLQHALLIGKYVRQFNGCLPIYGHMEDLYEFNRLTYKDITKGISYNENEAVHIGPFQISFLKTKHPAPCYAMRIEAEGHSLVYTGDTAFFPELAEFAYDADVFLCECNFYKGMDGAEAGHMTSIEAGSLANKADVKKLILTHLPHFGHLNQLKAEAAEQFSRDIVIAYEGLKIIV